VVHEYLILASFHRWIDKSPKRARSGGIVVDFDDGFWEAVQCSMYNKPNQNLVLELRPKPA